MVGGHLGEDFAVDIDLLGCHFGNEGRVFFTVFAESCIEARDPQAAESALFIASIPVGVFAGLEECFFGRAIGRFAAPHETFGGFQDFLSPL